MNDPSPFPDPAEIRILFVDDEKRVLNGIRRMLRPLVNRWEMHFAESATQALDILETSAVDVLISDIRMPGMDGAALFDEVRKRYPTVVRVALTGHTGQDLVAMTAKRAHQFLAKPCAREELIDTISRTRNLRPLLCNEHLRRIVSGTYELPSLPSFYLSLVEEMKRDRPSVERMASIIAKDVSMSARILQLVNSSFFGLRYTITDVHHAVSYVGMDMLRALVLLVQVFSSLTDDTISFQQFFDHSLWVSQLTGHIIKTMKCPQSRTETAVTVGLLHDLGWLLLMDAGELGEIPIFSEPRLMTQKGGIWGPCHAEMGAYLLGIWGIPNAVVQTVAHHHEPQRSEKPDLVLAVVHVAENLANQTPDQIDMNTLRSLKLAHHLGEWENMAEAMRQGKT